MDSESQRARLRQIVAQLHELNSPDAEVNKLGSDNVRVAIYEEDTRGIVTWAILRPFLKKYAKDFPVTATPPSDKEIEESVKIVLDHGNFLLTPELIKRHLRNVGPMSLAELAACRYPRGSAMWEQYQRKLAREIFGHARDLQLWHVEAVGRADKNGGGAIPGWKISAGQALIDFDEFVFYPKRLEQHRLFHRCHLFVLGRFRSGSSSQQTAPLRRCGHSAKATAPAPRAALRIAPAASATARHRAASDGGIKSLVLRSEITYLWRSSRIIDFVAPSVDHWPAIDVVDEGDQAFGASFVFLEPRRMWRSTERAI